MKRRTSFLKERIRYGRPIEKKRRRHVFSVRLTDEEILKVAQLNPDDVRKRLLKNES